MSFFNPKRMLIAATAAVALRRYCAGGRHLRRRRDLPVPDLLEVGGCL